MLYHGMVVDWLELKKTQKTAGQGAFYRASGRAVSGGILGETGRNPPV